MTEERIDKSTWGGGPWQTEPDRLEWRHAGFPCLMVRNDHMGHWCGYVGVPPGHPLHGKGYSEAEVYEAVSVHGGLTYARDCQENSHICHVAQSGEPEHVWWFGFDCAHGGDLSPAMRARLPLDLRMDDYETYKDLAYVREETNQLAEQLKPKEED
jgi:hypothetical protein